ncbi:hypothetical protein JTE90_019285 [Oedothorax gibbosus]|uniref:Uncharacterized protein n=1 Tax=Oedothorax gibbosus TaxID=931172 RepID=A0AAV6UY07_9ARAC|nr:hypothetical protein JTE90_019285 [Oedothorax gibbosus]
MVNPRFLLLGALLMMLSYEVDALDCSFSGLKISCPTALDNSDKVFCCSTGVSSLNVCCNIEDYMKENGPMIAGVVIGALVLLCLCTSVLRFKCPLHGAQVISSPPSSYSLVHPFPPSQFSNPPPPYQPTTVPNDQAQPPKNTYYQHHQ